MAETQDIREKKEKAGDSAFVREWLDAIDLASEDEKDWRKQAEEAEETYAAGEKSEGRSFNILHSNIETQRPAIYNAPPEPDVRRRFSDKDPSAKLISDIFERALSYGTDEYDLHSVLKAVTQSAILPGRGIARVRYRPTMQPVSDVEAEEQPEQIASQEVFWEWVDWKDYRHGPAKIWQDRPWEAFRHYLSRSELIRLAGEEIGKAVQLDKVTRPTQKERDQDDPVPELYSRAEVWEIWDRENKRVIFVARGYGERELKISDDPLSLKQFFPTPKPVQAITKPGCLTPVVPYEVYKPLACELNDVTERIARIIRTLKVRGLYAGLGGDIKSLESADDGELVPATDVEVFLQAGGLEKAIAWWPLDPAVKALEQLYVQREQVKQTIYEVTGIADILRGQTDAQETLGAQQIKAQWGSLRIKDLQEEIARFARDCYRLAAEIIANHFEVPHIADMTGIPAEEIAKVEPLLRNDLLRCYRVDIETDSTVRADMMRSQEQMNLFLQGTAQYASAMAPLIQLEPSAKPAIVAVFASFARNFNLGKSAEDALEKMLEGAQKPQPEKPDPEQIRAQAEQQKAQADQQMLQMKMQGEQQKIAGELQLKQADMALKQQEMDIKREEMALKREEMALEAQMMQAKFQVDMAGLQAKAANDAQSAEIKTQQMREQADIKSRQMRQQAKPKEKA